MNNCENQRHDHSHEKKFPNKPSSIKGNFIVQQAYEPEKTLHLVVVGKEKLFKHVDCSGIENFSNLTPGSVFHGEMNLEKERKRLINANQFLYGSGIIFYFQHQSRPLNEDRILIMRNGTIPYIESRFLIKTLVDKKLNPDKFMKEHFSLLKFQMEGMQPDELKLFENGAFETIYPFGKYSIKINDEIVKKIKETAAQIATNTERIIEDYDWSFPKGAKDSKDISAFERAKKESKEELPKDILEYFENKQAFSVKNATSSPHFCARKNGADYGYYLITLEDKDDFPEGEFEKGEYSKIGLYPVSFGMDHLPFTRKEKFKLLSLLTTAKVKANESPIHKSEIGELSQET